MLERFHLNHRVAFPDSNDVDIAALEKQLSELDARCILLTISDDRAEERIKSRNPQEWANKSNENMQQACQDLIDTQNRLRAQAAKSAIPTYEINTDLKDWNGYAKMIMEEQILFKL